MADPLDKTELAYDVSDEYRPEPEPIPEPPAWQDGSFRIGIHTSIAGDIAGALDIAVSKLGANALQIFPPARGCGRAEARALRMRTLPDFARGAPNWAWAAGHSRQLSDQSGVAGSRDAGAFDSGVS